MREFIFAHYFSAQFKNKKVPEKIAGVWIVFVLMLLYNKWNSQNDLSEDWNEIINFAKTAANYEIAGSVKKSEFKK